MKQFRYILESLVLLAFYGLCDILPAAAASGMGGWIGRHIGPRLAASRKARKNLQDSLPQLDDAAQDQAIRAMWDNLGRVIAEYPHLETIGRHHVELQGVEVIRHALSQSQPVILFGAHLANWEVMAPALLDKTGLKLGLVYRAPNNPVSDRLLDYARSLHGKLETIPKSRAGTRRLVQTLKEGNSIGILIDQKYNEGVSVAFFGRPAMTSPAFVQLARKYDACLIPFRCRRNNGCDFTVTFESPLSLDGDEIDVIARAHARLEDWIAQKPGDWMWLHRRWGKNEIQEA
ncbi:MAG: lysophospholipid acyltransferase family protein [Micavibrio aeruginosavorus]|uniref:Lysophospholipid acyltransferase family protein n=1 Tax=Micavibrio aeruginosavorus TaxID=349221 RepID=A0A7T5UGM9_9BACT|nr:MAG: lysophospholipid acyltransferase family protein [Micavibrio aeruginosavorus]